MAQPTKAKGGSRWGSLLSGAVAGLESRLDNILADEGTAAARNAEVERLRAEQKKLRESARSPALKDIGLSSRPSSSRASPKLGPLGTPISLPRTSQDVADSETVSRLSLSDSKADGERSGSARPSLDASTRPSLDVSDDASGIQASDGAKEVAALLENIKKTPEQLEEELAQVNTDLARHEKQHQEEIHEFEERIDAMQAKLKYLADEAVNNAKQAENTAVNGSTEVLIAQKDKQIADLLLEGQKLSKLEVTKAATIRQLRAKAAEDNRGFEEVRRALAQFEKTSLEMAEKVKRAEADRRDIQMRLNRYTRLDKEAKELRTERDTHQATIDELRLQLQTAAENAEEERKKGLTEALEKERRLVQSLRDDISNAKIEQSLREERAARELRASQEEVQREKDRSKSAELALRNEIMVLEGRLEVMRERTEEASAGQANESHAKLMRQIEVLQNQYSVASENWQGIESSLQARLSAVQSEKDEASRQETEARRKARENASSSRRLQEQMDDLTQRCQTMEQELIEKGSEADRLQLRANELERSLQDVKDEFAADRQSWNTTLASRIEEEKVKWQQELSHFASGTPEPSPGLISPPLNSATFNYRRPSGLDPMTISSRRSAARQPSDFSLHGDRHAYNRRPSAVNVRSHDAVSPNGLHSGRSTPGIFFGASELPPTPSVHPQTPSIHTMDPEDQAESASSPQRTVNEMLSVSTAAAGPSVQMMERMSAKVRRLESEKATTKDEMRRLTAQRDEARKDIVALMTEVEQKRETDKKVEKLESDLSQVSQRYHTTLEMLGERSERVEELQADVADLKKIYRELVESMIR